MALWPKICPIDECREWSPNLRTYVSHFRCAHQFSKALLIKCPMDGCLSRFTSADTFRRHAEWHHRVEYQPRTFRVATGVDIHESDDVANEETDNVDVLEDLPKVVESQEQYESFMEDIAVQSFRLRLEVEHKYDLPTSVAKQVFGAALNFALNMSQGLTGVAMSRVRELGITDDLLETILSSPDLERSCKSIHESSLITKLGLVEPREVDLIEEARRLGRPQPTVEDNIKKPVMHYVPILDTIKSFLSHPDVMQTVLRESSSSSHYGSFRDGSLYKEHALFTEEPNALRLTLYTDELELCNPLGGNKVKHKICCVYFQVANVGSKYLSSLSTVHLALLVKDSLKCHFGYDVVLRPLINDLKVLAEDGVSVSLKGGGTYHFRGAVATFCGDNLSAHHLAGFRRTFSSGKVCRWCMADYSVLSQISSERQCTLRTELSIERHARLASQDGRLQAIYGVSGPSALTEIPHFRLPYCLPPDIMHDVLEKVICLNIKVVLKGLNKHKVVTFQDVRRLLSRFRFGVLDRENKHPGLQEKLLTDKKTIQGSASQKLHLFHFFSLIIGPHVPEGNRYWQLHLLFNRICDIIFGDKISEDMIRNLERLVKKHHDLWVQLVQGVYPPKLHYLVHYGTFIRRVGPLRFQWCMRFEAFHQYIKRMSQKCNNFKNITKSMACRVQKKRCVLYSGHTALPPEVEIASKQTTKTVGCLSLIIQAMLKESHALQPSDRILEVTSVVFRGLKLRPKCWYISDVSAEGVPLFLLAKQIFIINEEVVIFGNLHKASAFNEHLHAYELNITESECNVVPASNLKPFHALHSYKVSGGLFIKLKFSVL